MSKVEGAPAEAVAVEGKPRAVSLEVARAVIWYFGDTNLGIEPGSFVTIHRQSRA